MLSLGSPIRKRTRAGPVPRCWLHSKAQPRVSTGGVSPPPLGATSRGTFGSHACGGIGGFVSRLEAGRDNANAERGALPIRAECRMPGHAGIGNAVRRLPGPVTRIPASSTGHPSCSSDACPSEGRSRAWILILPSRPLHLWPPTVEVPIDGVPHDQPSLPSRCRVVRDWLRAGVSAPAGASPDRRSDRQCRSARTFSTSDPETGSLDRERRSPGSRQPRERNHAQRAARTPLVADPVIGSTHRRPRQSRPFSHRLAHRYGSQCGTPTGAWLSTIVIPMPSRRASAEVYERGDPAFLMPASARGRPRGARPFPVGAPARQVP